MPGKTCMPAHFKQPQGTLSSVTASRPHLCLAIDQHLVVRIVRALDHRRSKLHHHILRGQRAGQSELEDARIRVTQPVILDHVLRHDVGRQHRRAGTRCAGVAQRPVRNQRKIAGLRRQHLHREARGDLARAQHHVELALHLAINQVQQHRVGIDRRGPHGKVGVAHHLCHRRLEAIHNAGRSADGGRVAPCRNLLRDAIILRRRGRGQRGIAAIPQGNIVRVHHALNRIDEVLGLQIRKLLLLRAQFHIKQVVVELSHNGLQRNAALHARRAYHRSHNVARIHKAGRARSRNRSLFKEARRMTGGRHLLDALAKQAAAANDVGDLRLIKRNFNRARPNVIRCGMDVVKIGFHQSLSALWAC
ncbi:conserved domain protein [Acidobacterium capsulatum ATCC 51196]|uniref:Conserved domain protein n=1 Tax=Acidobacterium capsulatum (strain ATCC 51196 / DSM 11244 / BCRC 80197 / JCM 7670 / NBRC 15755 / NCIMB 13165 / 161) TaxID=240015 RepID=C1FAG4_ACIC5|nr:conserved domain protein [Acidobacterium capsulatum ATCC 51196]